MTFLSIINGYIYIYTHTYTVFYTNTCHYLPICIFACIYVNTHIMHILSPPVRRVKVQAPSKMTPLLLLLCVKACVIDLPQRYWQSMAKWCQEARNLPAANCCKSTHARAHTHTPAHTHTQRVVALLSMNHFTVASMHLSKA